MMSGAEVWGGIGVHSKGVHFRALCKTLEFFHSKRFCFYGLWPGTRSCWNMFGSLKLALCWMIFCWHNRTLSHLSKDNLWAWRLLPHWAKIKQEDVWLHKTRDSTIHTIGANSKCTQNTWYLKVELDFYTWNGSLWVTKFWVNLFHRSYFTPRLTMNPGHL